VAYNEPLETVGDTPTWQASNSIPGSIRTLLRYQPDHFQEFRSRMIEMPLLVGYIRLSSPVDTSSRRCLERN
jgi:hypothetical protein